MRDHAVSWWRLVWVGTGTIVVAIIVACLLALTVSFGREMADYLQNSTGLVVAPTTTEPSPPPQAVPPRAEPVPIAVEPPAQQRNDDAAELRASTGPADPL
ncbi:MAG TPA: hypothetical protein VFR30_10515 [Lysobacter sp.]|nr:hypothetical protein [Lysobacter sp.]